MIRVEGALKQWRETPGMPGLDGLGGADCMVARCRKPLRLQEKVWSYMYSTRRTATAATAIVCQRFGVKNLERSSSENKPLRIEERLDDFLQLWMHMCGLHSFILQTMDVRHSFDLRCPCCSRGSPAQFQVSSDVAEAPPHGGQVGEF